MGGVAETLAAKTKAKTTKASTKGERTRHALLAGAIRRFAADGYRATSLADIARDARVTPAAAYAYFANKEALFTEAVLKTQPLPGGRAVALFGFPSLEAALRPKPTRRQYARKLDGAAEAHLIALACSPAPEGRAQWTLRLLANRLVELEHVGSVSHETVRRTLKKTSCSRT